MNRHFQLFGLPERFDLDSRDLEQRYHTLAARFHPDKTAAASAFEQRQAVMMSAAVNEAYRVLKHPLSRAAALLEQQGIDAVSPEHTQFPPEFLMQQMEWREALAEAQGAADHAALAQLAATIATAQQTLYADLQQAFAEQDFEAAARWLRQGYFLEKIQQEIATAA